jgi:hypothetical protein
MACKLVTTTIQGRVVTLTQSNCMDGINELSKLLTVTGKVSYDYLSGESNIHHHLALIQSCAAEDIEYIKSIVCKCAIEGKMHKVETVGLFMQNNYLLLVEVFAFYISANYKEFFTEGLQEIESKKEAAILLVEQEEKTKLASEL